MVQFLALLVFFSLIAFERFGVSFKYNDLFIGLAALVVAATLILDGSAEF